MGADCCGTGAIEAAFAAATLEQHGDAAAAPAGQPQKTFEDAVKERTPYYQKRIQLFEQYKKREDEAMEAAKAANAPITVTLPDGSTKPGVRGVTTPMDVANSISKSLAKKVVVASVDDKPWDLLRSLEGDAALKLHTFDDPEGKDCFWHSSAHVLGQALELELGADLTIGPALEEGFYYDCYLEERTLSEADKPRIESRIKEAVKGKQAFQRVVVSRDEALGMFQENKFKVEIIEGLPADATITLYRVGPMVDLCTGPHLPNSGYLKSVAITNMSRAMWRADASKEPLQRVYGITFPDDASLKDYLHRMEEAKKRDHRNVGTQMELFFFHQLSPGSCFFHPNGTRVYNALITLMRDKYWEYEYDEVVSPNIFNFDLWKTSGHADHYKENMFSFDVEAAEYGLKPMNCPGHCLMYANRVRSYRELPLRLAEFGVLHRNEYSGALQGLTRVRRFVQDDAHIFCRPDQVKQEIGTFLQMLSQVYGIFGLDYSLKLSTRPEKYLGELSQWNDAERALEEALNATGRPWELNEGDGAFYGPKIDIAVMDALRRKFQCATVQLDFQLPQRFKLQYMTEDGYGTPVMVHRAILGSVERMFAILTEHFAGKWPLWLSPRQVMVVPISEVSYDYARHVRGIVRAAVVGEEEKKANTVNVRTRDNHVHGMYSLDDLMVVLKKERDTRSLVGLFGEANPSS